MAKLEESSTCIYLNNKKSDCKTGCKKMLMALTGIQKSPRKIENSSVSLVSISNNTSNSKSKKVIKRNPEPTEQIKDFKKFKIVMAKKHLKLQNEVSQGTFEKSSDPISTVVFDVNLFNENRTNKFQMHK